MVHVEVVTYQPGNLTPDPVTHTLQKLEILLRSSGFQVKTNEHGVHADHAELGSIYAEVKQ